MGGGDRPPPSSKTYRFPRAMFSQTTFRLGGTTLFSACQGEHLVFGSEARGPGPGPRAKAPGPGPRARAPGPGPGPRARAAPPRGAGACGPPRRPKGPPKAKGLRARGPPTGGEALAPYKPTIALSYELHVRRAEEVEELETLVLMTIAGRHQGPAESLFVQYQREVRIYILACWPEPERAQGPGPGPKPGARSRGP